MDLKARVDVNCEQKDGQMENRTPMSHTAKAGATKMFPYYHIMFQNRCLNCAQQLISLILLFPKFPLFP